jgi:hypothetical protein
LGCSHTKLSEPHSHCVSRCLTDNQAWLDEDSEEEEEDFDESDEDEDEDDYDEKTDEKFDPETMEDEHEFSDNETPYVARQQHDAQEVQAVRADNSLYLNTIY